MADLTFNTPAGAAAARKLFLLYMNTGTEELPVWSVIGKRVEDSSVEFDWGEETGKDILGNVHTMLGEPTMKQSFDPCQIDSSDKAQEKIWNMAVKDHDTGALQACDLLLVHAYAGTADTAVFAERYPESTVLPTGLGGSSYVGMPIDVTFGGARDTGTAAIAEGVVTFTSDKAKG